MQRDELIQILQRWRDAADRQFDELVRDIVDLLAALPYEMVVLEDVPVFLDALANPPHETDLSVNLLWNHMDVVDVDTRRLQLAQHPFYGQFAGAD